ncbi:MAG TPA: phosphate-starvation-inducible PsiE family protein [Candidatus Limnocylindria bacterium]|nr:phosphate-starvation-inducible PsiE family protein [Candidatus Limnocylindria bacterium]
MSEGPRRRSALEKASLAVLSATEHVVFVVIGALLFLVALALLVHTALTAVPIFVPGVDVMETGTAVLDRILLVLMVVELAYTVLLSLRGAVLSAEPFLIVGLIAVIRRILVITVGEPRTGTTVHSASSATLLELGVLTSVVLVFVASIVLLRLRPRVRNGDRLAAEGHEVRREDP